MTISSKVHTIDVKEKTSPGPVVVTYVCLTVVSGMNASRHQSRFNTSADVELTPRHRPSATMCMQSVSQSCSLSSNQLPNPLSEIGPNLLHLLLDRLNEQMNPPAPTSNNRNHARAGLVPSQSEPYARASRSNSRVIGEIVPPRPHTDQLDDGHSRLEKGPTISACLRRLFVGNKGHM